MPLTSAGAGAGWGEVHPDQKHMVEIEVKLIKLLGPKQISFGHDMNGLN